MILNAAKSIGGGSFLCVRLGLNTAAGRLPRQSLGSPLTSRNLYQSSYLSSSRHSQRNKSDSRRRRYCSLVAMSSGGKKVLVPIGSGSEEMEAVIIIDVLRRAGAHVTVASVEDSLQEKMSRKVKLVADALISDVANDSFDAIALPGGMPGAERLRDSPMLLKLVDKQRNDGKIWSAICASPAVVLESQGWLKGKKATAHPGFVAKLADQSEANSRVVVDGDLITSRGPGTAFEFALALVEKLFGNEKADEIAGPMVLHDMTPAKHV